VNRGERQHEERRAFARRQARTPGYSPKHAGKTPGKLCSGPCCGNPRRHFGEVTAQELRSEPAPDAETPWDEVDTAGDVCPHGGDAGCCEEWECLTGEPVESVSPPLSAPLARLARAS
jgi:hypothetical protein